MSLVKDALLDLLEAIYPGNFGAQEDLQTRLMAGKGLSTEEFAIAQATEVGRLMIDNHLVQEGIHA